ncbi:MAG: acetyltransferase [Sulfuritalea sp.]|nr:acetyltransferase [Sulfuritalea sp.]
MKRPGMILLGAGGHAHACVDVIEQHGRYEIAGLVGMPEEANSTSLGYSVIASDRDLPELTKACRYALVTVGQIGSAENRMRLYRLAAEQGFELPAIVSPLAYVSRHAVIGAGTIVMHGAIINAGARLGNNCIVNTRALVEHDATIEDHCHISTGAILNGNVRLGAGSFVGSSSTIREGVALGKACIVGMGVAVRHDQPDGARFVGKGKP